MVFLLIYQPNYNTQLWLFWTFLLSIAVCTMRNILELKIKISNMNNLQSYFYSTVCKYYYIIDARRKKTLFTK